MPLWIISDAIFYSLGYNSQGNEYAESRFIERSKNADRLFAYINDAAKTSALIVYPNEGVGWSPAEGISYNYKVKPNQFIEWSSTLPIETSLQRKELQPDCLCSVGYTTAYLELMVRAIKELEISDENQPLIDTLVSWFLENDATITKPDAKKMATFVRQPMMRAGGYRVDKLKRG